MVDEIKKYTADEIQVLEGLEAVRKRPGMYIGSTSSRGLHHLVYEVIDNSIDEFLAGYGHNINAIIHKDNSVTVLDEGRGIPVGIHPKMGLPAVELVLTTLHAGGKFGGSGYKVSGGLHGVGVSVVNALSEFLEVEVSREDKIFHQRYEKGKTVSELKVIGTSTHNGTKIFFKPDAEIFEDLNYDFKTLAQRLRELSFLNKGLTITLVDERNNTEETFVHDGGIKDYVKYLNKNKDLIHDEVVYFEDTKDDISVEVAIQYNGGYSENILSYANNINTHEGGTHEYSFKTALTRVINSYAKKCNILKASDPNLTGEDVREGIVCIVSIKLPNPQFEGQTKAKLNNSEIKNIIDSIVDNGLNVFFKENPYVVKKIIDKSIKSFKARESARKARELTRRKCALESTSLPGKLADCSNKNPALCEVCIVEGNSAGGSAKQGRDRKFQAILPLRGKILNVEKASLDKILKNEEIKSMVTAIGAGVGKDFDIEKVRYHKIIIMTDADVDGSHIRTLLLTFFYRFMRPLIEHGYIYIAQPPLYKLTKNKREKYFYHDNDLGKYLDKNGKEGIFIQRYKGLGEMNPEQLWNTTMNPETRTLIQVDLKDLEETEDTFSILMGDKVEPRKKFIFKNSNQVKNLDI